MLAIYDGREALWQWDIGQKLLVTHEGVCEVHFKQPGEETALTVQTYDLGGQTVANVPNILLQEAGKLTAYIYVCVGDAYTIQKAIFTIKPRPRPADYVYTETEVKTYSTLEKRLDEIEANLDARSKNVLPLLLKKLQCERKLTIIMVMHDLDLALHCADNFYGMADGKITFSGDCHAPDFMEKLSVWNNGRYRFFTGENGLLRALPCFA